MRQEIMKHPLLLDHRTEEEKKADVPVVVIRVVNLATLHNAACMGMGGNGCKRHGDEIRPLKEHQGAL